MKPFRSIAVTFNARLRQAVNQMENHEALAESIIGDVARSAARAKVQLGRIRDEAKRHEGEMDRLREEEALWISRARKVHGLDESRSLECVRRLKKVRLALEEQVRQVKESSALEHQLSGDLARIEGKLALLRRRKKSLAGRQNTAAALTTVQEGNLGLSDEITDLFTRWETKVTEWEIRAGNSPEERDELVESFTREEEEEDLKECLREILSGENPGISPENKDSGST